jgi:hypothetical protein
VLDHGKIQLMTLLLASASLTTCKSRPTSDVAGTTASVDAKWYNETLPQVIKRDKALVVELRDLFARLASGERLDDLNVPKVVKFADMFANNAAVLSKAAANFRQ